MRRSWTTSGHWRGHWRSLAWALGIGHWRGQTAHASGWRASHESRVRRPQCACGGDPSRCHSYGPKVMNHRCRELAKASRLVSCTCSPLRRTQLHCGSRSARRALAASLTSFRTSHTLSHSSRDSRPQAARKRLHGLEALRLRDRQARRSCVRALHTRPPGPHSRQLRTPTRTLKRAAAPPPPSADRAPLRMGHVLTRPPPRPCALPSPSPSGFANNAVSAPAAPAAPQLTGEGASPRALTRAEPQMTPSAPHETICLACSGRDTPKPTHTCAAQHARRTRAAHGASRATS
jgi:hypothetical protein